MQRYDLNLVIALVALLETRSVTQSAERLHLSVPATSRMLGRLRGAFGDQLLVRAGSRLVTTPRGAALLQPARDALAAVTALPRIGAPQDLSTLRHRFIVCLPDPMAVMLAAPLISALASVMPEASLALVASDHDPAGSLRDGRLDIVIGADLPVLPELRHALLSEQALVGVVRVGHPLGRGRPSASRFAQTGRVSVQVPAGRVDAVDEAFERLGLRSRALLSVPGAYAAMAAAAGSDMLACVPERIARAVAASLRLQVLRLPFPVSAERLSMAWHPRTEVAPGHVWLRSRLLALIDQRPTAGRGGTP